MRDELDPRYRLVRLADTPELGNDAVIDFWLREGAMPEPTALQRVAEVSFVALEGDDLAAITTIYLQHHERLRTEMWHLRSFVGADHRRSTLAAFLLRENRVDLERAYVSGEDRRAPGIVMEIESSVLKGRTEAVWSAGWSPARYYFIGENAKGDHVRVLYFQGATVPLP